MSDENEDKQTRDSHDDTLMSAVALSVALDGPINPAMVDSDPRPSRPSRTVTVSTGLANAGKSLTDSLSAGVEPWALIFTPISNQNVVRAKNEAEAIAAKDSKPQSAQQGALSATGATADGVAIGTSKVGNSTRVSQDLALRG